MSATRRKRRSTYPSTRTTESRENVKKKALAALAAAAAVLLTSCGARTAFSEWKDESGSAFTVDGRDVMKSEVAYYFSNERSLDKKSSDAELFGEKVLPDIIFPRAAEKIADEHGVSLTDKEQKGIDKSAEELDGTAKDDAQKALWRHILEGTQLCTKLLEYYQSEETSPAKASDENIRAAIKSEDFVHFKSIIIMNDDGDDVNENIATAERVRARAAAGEDFDALAAEYSEDPAYEDNGCDYYVFRHEMIAPVEDAAFSLADGELSDVIEVNDSYSGYNIILRLPTDDDWTEKNFDNLRNNYKSYVFYRDIYEKAAELSVSDTSDIDFSEFK